jgi:hypothetical protein
MDTCMTQEHTFQTTLNVGQMLADLTGLVKNSMSWSSSQEWRGWVDETDGAADAVGCSGTCTGAGTAAAAPACKSALIPCTGARERRSTVMHLSPTTRTMTIAEGDGDVECTGAAESDGGGGAVGKVAGVSDTDKGVASWH